MNSTGKHITLVRTVLNQLKYRSTCKMEKLSIDNLVRTYGKKVYNLAYRLIGNRQDAEDITQETFLQVYRGLDIRNMMDEILLSKVLKEAALFIP